MDPIGLTGTEGEREGSDAADEYDTYLMQVVGRARKGEADETIVDYLVWVETEHMGLSPSTTTRSRAEAMVSAIREYLTTIT